MPDLTSLPHWGVRFGTKVGQNGPRLYQSLLRSVLSYLKCPGFLPFGTNLTQSDSLWAQIWDPSCHRTATISTSTFMLTSPKPAHTNSWNPRYLPKKMYHYRAVLVMKHPQRFMNQDKFIGNPRTLQIDVQSISISTFSITYPDALPCTDTDCAESVPD